MKNKNQSLMAYWGPASFEENGLISEVSKNNLLQYKDCGFDTLVIPGIKSNCVTSNLNGVNCFNNSLLKKIMDYCASINLKVLVRDELIIYLSHCKMDLVKTSKKKKILFVKVKQMDVKGNDGNNYHFSDGEIIFLDVNQKEDKKGISFAFNRNVNLYISKSKIIETYFQFENNKTFIKKIKNIIYQYCKHSSYFGIEFWDEPSLDTFVAIRQLSTAIKKINKKTFIQQCLLPNYATDELYGGLIENVSFETYINEYAKMCHESKTMNYIRCDVYPFRINEHNKQNYVMEDYLKCLKIFAKTASKYNLDWELCVQTYSDPLMQEIDNDKLLFQINAAIALGARNVCYYTYTYDTHGHYFSGIVDGNYKTGYKPNKIFEYIKQANKFLKKTAKLYKHNRLIDCKYYQSSTNFIDDNSMETTKNEIKNWKGNFIYSELKNKTNKRYAITPIYSENKKSFVNLTIANKKTIFSLIDNKTIKTENIMVDNNKILIFK